MVDISTLSTKELLGLRSRINEILDGPPGITVEVSDAIATMKTMREKIVAVGKATVTKAINALLAKHPEVESIRWTQYTPYFNDGDACEFSVNDPEVRLLNEQVVGGGGDVNDEDEDDVNDEDEDEDNEGYQGAWDLGYCAKQRGEAKPEALMKSLESLGEVFGESEDAMLATFGDHVQVTVGRDGVANVEEYSHE